MPQPVNAQTQQLINENSLNILEEEIRAIATELNIQTELDATITGAGLEANGAYAVNATADYISGAKTLSEADSFLDAQKKLLKVQKEENAQNAMLTTAVVLEMKKDTFCLAHVGDSRGYYFNKNKVVSRTFDHSVPQMLVNSKKIKEKDIRHHPDRSRLLRAMGTNWDKPLYDIEKKIKRKSHSKQAFLLCSDGFWELIEEKEMERIYRTSNSVNEWISKMELVVNENGKDTNMDNYSAIGVWIYE
jgi:serine/threonine protein phosphatase PrpC